VQHADHRAYYDYETRAFIADVHARDIELFDYAF